jgi:hypothetical protein
MQKVRFTKAYPAVYKQGIIAAAGVLRYPLCCGMGEAVACTYQERFKSIPAIELGRCSPLAEFIRGCRRGSGCDFGIAVTQLDLKLYPERTTRNTADGLFYQRMQALFQ